MASDRVARSMKAAATPAAITISPTRAVARPRAWPSPASSDAELIRIGMIRIAVMATKCSVAMPVTSRAVAAATRRGSGLR